MTFIRYAAILAATTAITAPAFAQERAVSDLPIAAQMYTLRDFGTLDEQLAAVAAAGVTAVETVGTQNVTAEELKALLDKHGIEAISTHAQLAALRDDVDAVIAFNKAIGNDVITVPFLPEDQRPTTAEGWAELGTELGEIAATLAAQDMRMAYHNHAFELVDYDGKTGLEIMFDAAGEGLEAELDVAWVARTEYEPAEFISRFDGRLFAIHAKDNYPTGEGEAERGFAILGTGVVDFDAILPAAEAAGAEWYIIEHDMPVDASVVVAEGAAFLAGNLPEGATR
ncbi:sugar phosphate isomerase/epimerase family protein [Ketogulonicigenium vulgare]|uniref:Xylose isomerase domain protein TIM barrel n=1 Tax=Ketogulonicigenium vulgare (strain WSH-001) TaxID=759362 RepID=F9Y7N9_KETVW|nr:sugar phosphate isomerase/epimerase [Ketogulonicigenium vulgare]ADO41614.1 Xylose isomerase domain protein TIM barrel [Ketogulonicigenium vulgare Y25]AEM39855.1 Xylose isomerase domain protein TIM barrel [Ketogulonicigenium vulgare WSH-001]ALJ80070.1 xylose isomerase [Ketogulonicigenium vulgare]ANW32947.1 xylose isomerase [Ketogulonicigenium vulgare]AOZ53544.1 Xylose isomerase domain protein TIM barrel [Ketogulonicigenium vulgare]